MEAYRGSGTGPVAEEGPSWPLDPLATWAAIMSPPAWLISADLRLTEAPGGTFCTWPRAMLASPDWQASQCPPSLVICRPRAAYWPPAKQLIHFNMSPLQSRPLIFFFFSNWSLSNSIPKLKEQSTRLAHVGQARLSSLEWELTAVPTGRKTI